MAAEGVAGEAYTGCEHYSRRVQLLAPCCNQFFPCRFCHDAVKDDGEPDPKKAHKLDRKLVKVVKCMVCNLEQPPKRECAGCGTVLGHYFCSVCVLFDDNGEKKGIFHCEGCTICRVGGRDKYVHCDGCAMCIAKKEGPHKCSKYANSNCPVCLEDIFTSRKNAMPLENCAHVMHQECMSALLSSGQYKCPMCGKAMVDMAGQWRSMDSEWALEVMPQEYRRKGCKIQCLDCGRESVTPFSVSGLRCLHPACGGYNTTRTGQGMEALPTTTSSTTLPAPVATRMTAQEVTALQLVGMRQLATCIRRVCGMKRVSGHDRHALVLTLKATVEWMADSLEQIRQAQQDEELGGVPLAASLRHAARAVYRHAAALVAPAHPPEVGAEGQAVAQHVAAAVAAEAAAQHADGGEAGEEDESIHSSDFEDARGGEDGEDGEESGEDDEAEGSSSSGDDEDGEDEDEEMGDEGGPVEAMDEAAGSNSAAAGDGELGPVQDMMAIITRLVTQIVGLPGVAGEPPEPPSATQAQHRETVEAVLAPLRDVVSRLSL